MEQLYKIHVVNIFQFDYIKYSFSSYSELVKTGILPVGTKTIRPIYVDQLARRTQPSEKKHIHPKCFGANRWSYQRKKRRSLYREVYKWHIPEYVILVKKMTGYQEMLTGENVLSLYEVLTTDIECGVVYIPYRYENDNEKEEPKRGLPCKTSIEEVGNNFKGFNEEHVRRLFLKFAQPGKAKMDYYRAFIREEEARIKTLTEAKKKGNLNRGSDLISRYVERDR